MKTKTIVETNGNETTYKEVPIWKYHNCRFAPINVYICGMSNNYWVLKHPTSDGWFQKPFVSTLPIEFCPYCGNKLEWKDDK